MFFQGSWVQLLSTTWWLRTLYNEICALFFSQHILSAVEQLWVPRKPTCYCLRPQGGLTLFTIPPRWPFPGANCQHLYLSEQYLESLRNWSLKVVSSKNTGLAHTLSSPDAMDGFGCLFASFVNLTQAETIPKRTESLWRNCLYQICL